MNLGQIRFELDDPDGPNPALMATIFFDAIAPGTASVVGSPADRLPESDTLVFNNDEPIDIAKIRYDAVDITVVGSALQNSSFPQDVDGDGEATALDALIIVNRLNRLGDGENSIPNDGFFTDVNGDFKVTALDALQVINYISTKNGSGEAEATPQAVQVPTVRTLEDDTDAAFADLSVDEVAKLVANDDSSGQSTPAGPMINVADDDRDDDDGLDLFADDIFGQWN